MKLRGFAALGVMCAVLVACGSSNSETTEGNEATAQQSQSTPMLELFVGKSPFDEVDGIRFLDHPTVVDTAKRLLKDEGLSQFILSGNNTFGTIENLNGMGVISYGCEAHNCTGKSWAIFMGDEKIGNQEQSYVCYFDSDNPAKSGMYNKYGKENINSTCSKPYNTNVENNYSPTAQFTAEKMVKRFGPREMYPEIFATNLNDGNIELTEIIMNRGNCEIFYVAKNEVVYSLPTTLAYGDKLTIRGSCDPSEISFVTSMGTATINWN